MKWFWILSLYSALFAFEVSVDLDRTEISIADPVKWTLEVTTEGKGTVELPGIVGNFGAFEIKDFKVFPEEKADGKSVYKWEYNLSSFLSGDYVIPPQLVLYHLDGKTDSVETNPVSVKVLSTLNQDMEDILDVEPVTVPPKPWLRWTLYGLVGSLVLALFVWLFLFLKKRKSNQHLSPRERAEKRLQVLENSSYDFGLFENQKNYTTELSDLLRTYLEEEIQLEALESTSKELQKKAQKHTHFPSLLLEDLEAFGKKADLVKFARIPLKKEELDDLAIRVKKMVRGVKAPELEGGKRK